MAHPFLSGIRAALADPGLQSALDANAERRQHVQQQAQAGLPDYPALRRRAHRVRAYTLENLESLLEAFSTRARQNGLVVHRAADAREANEIVLGIARETGARLVAKSKTMVSEEVGLNHALEQAGFEVVETDLGEYIVQLRGERPSHIITPAVHLRRKQVGQTFHDRLGLPLTDDVEALTAAARSQLRQVFARADLGVSGVNFGVVESGTLCLITNEGNGRMVTTLPPVHIALMGIERLVPTLDDLALMLALLPRAATGQKATVYVNLIHSPRRPEETEGPIQRHLILVDNGRRALQASPLAEALLCIRCGACLNACPVFREIGGHAYVDTGGKSSVYPGPIGSIVSPGLFGQAEFGHLARASTLCGACREACPVDIDLPGLLLRTRAGGTQPPSQAAPAEVPLRMRWALGLYTWLATNPQRFAAAQRLAARLSRWIAPAGGWLRLPGLTGWGQGRRFPPPASPPLRDRLAGAGSGEAASMAGSPPPRVNGSPQEAPEHRPGGPQDGAPQAGESDAQLDKPARAHSQINREVRVARFSAELGELGGTFVRARSDDLAPLILAFLRERGEDHILAWEEDHLPGGVLQALSAAGVQVSHQAGVPDVVERSPRVGLTGAPAAVAETGSLVVPGGPGRPLAASLLPDIHLAVLRAGDIQDSLAEALAMDEVRASSAAVLISGPSRTADIEMTLTIGVHGPRQVHVFCYG